MNEITVNDVSKMTNIEGLVLQGCGGDPQEWIDGINKLLTEQGILLKGDTFKEVSCFKHDGLTNLIFHMDSVELDLGKLAIWRLQTNEQFGGMWLSDYLHNRLGVLPDQKLETEKPDCPIIGADGNIFNLMGIASRTLREHGKEKEAEEMCSRIKESGSFIVALSVLMDYINPVGIDEQNKEMGMEAGM
ncbi:hypothetical protein [Lacrimispora sp.]|uniref:hypothetical protein n=1 Tax=Lacrimispora sp. TaxID=2719234 RepID=UPI0028B02952|nr:hypothetical protein [Lacrimispora sp.]